jgi:hypothetical protein
LDSFAWTFLEKKKGAMHLNRLIPPPNIPSKFGIDNANDDEVIHDMEGTTRDAINGMETNFDEVS